MTNKARLRAFIDAVWIAGDLDALPQFWTEDCVNHAAPGPDNRGLVALRAYHQQFAAAFAAFDDIDIQIVQQLEEADRVATQLRARVVHRRPFAGVAPTGRAATLSSMRIDRMEGGRIAEHWSAADMAGFMEQLRA